MRSKLSLRMAALLIAVLVVVVAALTLSAEAQERPPIRIQRPPVQLPREILVRAAGPTVAFETRIDPNLLQRASGLNVYRLEPPRFDRSVFGALGERLFEGQLRGQQVQLEGLMAMSSADNPSDFLLLDTQSGLLSFSRGMADQIDDRRGELPGEEQAASIARNFLMQMGLGPRDEKQMVLAHVGRIRSRSFDPQTGNEGPVLDQMLTVYFGRQVDDLMVVGGGSKMIVQIGDGGRGVGAGVRWRELGAATRVDAKNLRSAEQLMQDIRTFMGTEQRQAQRVAITRAALFYYDNGGNFLQPILGYQARIRAGEFEYNYFGQTALLVNPPELVGPEPLSRQAVETLQKGAEDLQAPTRIPTD
ncbi:MAG: hypothetical protein AB7Y46_16010 [Armatimonadota bacterium]